MNWRVKGLVQRALASLPGGVQMNDWMQQLLGGLRDFNGTVQTKVVSDWLVLVNNMNECGIGTQWRDFLEVGTGWMPVLPVCFSLGGASSCTTIDSVRHMNPRLTFRMLAGLEEYLPKIAAASQRPLEQVEKDYRNLRQAPTLAAMLERARIRYISPADACATELAADSVDVVFSNNVFEHVSGDILSGILRESSRILKPGGLSMHSVNCADHYAYFDRNITFVNYLTYSDREWQFWNNKIQYQNRLRPQDYVDLAMKAGLEVKICKMRMREELLPVLSRMQIAPEFQKYSAEQLCSTSILLGGVKTMTPPARIRMVTHTLESLA
jgi:predicted SAM-dependent methyltransferase